MIGVQVWEGDGTIPEGCHPPGSARIFARNVTDASPVGFLLIRDGGHLVFVDDQIQATLWENRNVAERLRTRLAQTHQQFTYEIVTAG